MLQKKQQKKGKKEVKKHSKNLPIYMPTICLRALSYHRPCKAKKCKFPWNCENKESAQEKRKQINKHKNNVYTQQCNICVAIWRGYKRKVARICSLKAKNKRKKTKSTCATSRCACVRMYCWCIYVCTLGEQKARAACRPPPASQPASKCGCQVKVIPFCLLSKCNA